MSQIACNKTTDKIIYANDFDEFHWDKLRSLSDQGEILMNCCGARSVLKTSPGFLKFFSHYSGECSSAPETRWHLEVKSLIIRELSILGAMGIGEKIGVSKNGKKWRADTYFEYEGRKIVIEIQYSYQHLKKYIERQNIYKDSGVECYWLLYPKCFLKLTKSIANFRLENEFNRIIPSGFYGNTPEIPMMWADVDVDVDVDVKIKNVAFIEYSLTLWIQSILKMKFVYKDFKWLIDK